MSSNPRSIQEVVESLAQEADRAAAARQDPAIREALSAPYAGRVVSLPDLRRAERERDWAARGVPARMWPALHDGAPGEPPGPTAPQATAALDRVGRFLAPSEPKRGLILSGRPDTGKTFAAAWGAAWHGGRVVKALDVLRAGLYPDDRSFWPRLFGERLLVVDDLGTDPLDAKGYGLSAITDLVDRRYDACLRTILTTNLDLVAFRERYGTGAGERLWRRIRETYAFFEVTSRSPNTPPAAATEASP